MIFLHKTKGKQTLNTRIFIKSLYNSLFIQNTEIKPYKSIAAQSLSMKIEKLSKNPGIQTGHTGHIQKISGIHRQKRIFFPVQSKRKDNNGMCQQRFISYTKMLISVFRGAFICPMESIS